MYRAKRTQAFWSSFIAFTFIGFICAKLLGFSGYEGLAAFAFITLLITGLIVGCVKLNQNNNRAYIATILAHGDFGLYNTMLQEREIRSIKFENWFSAFEGAYAGARANNPDGYPIKDGFAFQADIRFREQLLNNQCLNQFAQIRRSNYVNPDLIALVNELIAKHRNAADTERYVARELYNLYNETKGGIHQ